MVLAGTGCDLGRDLRGPAGQDVAASPGADVALVDGLRSELLGVLGLLERTATAHPGLSDVTARLVELHGHHLELLEGAGEDSADNAEEDREQGQGEVAEQPVRAVEARALHALRSRERRLQKRLADAAVAAESGALAGLLASMSAAVAQQLARWPRASRTTSDGAR